MEAGAAKEVNSLTVDAPYKLIMVLATTIMAGVEDMATVQEEGEVMAEQEVLPTITAEQAPKALCISNAFLDRLYNPMKRRRFYAHCHLVFSLRQS